MNADELKGEIPCNFSYTVLVQFSCVLSRQCSSVLVQCVGVALKVPAFEEVLCGDEGVAVNDFCLSTPWPVHHTFVAKADAPTSPFWSARQCSLRQRVLPGWPFISIHVVCIILHTFIIFYFSLLFICHHTIPCYHHPYIYAWVFCLSLFPDDGSCTETF